MKEFQAANPDLVYNTGSKSVYSDCLSENEKVARDFHFVVSICCCLFCEQTLEKNKKQGAYI